MENLIELLKQQQEGYDDIKAEKKLSLFYHKAHGAGIETFLEESICFVNNNHSKNSSKKVSMPAP